MPGITRRGRRDKQDTNTATQVAPPVQPVAPEFSTSPVVSPIVPESQTPFVPETQEVYTEGEQSRDEPVAPTEVDEMAGRARANATPATKTETPETPAETEATPVAEVTDTDNVPAGDEKRRKHWTVEDVKIAAAPQEVTALPMITRGRTRRETPFDEFIKLSVANGKPYMVSVQNPLPRDKWTEDQAEAWKPAESMIRSATKSLSNGEWGVSIRTLADENDPNTETKNEGQFNIYFAVQRKTSKTA